jgi:hypothetical protein
MNKLIYFVSIKRTNKTYIFLDNLRRNNYKLWLNYLQSGILERYFSFDSILYSRNNLDAFSGSPIYLRDLTNYLIKIIKSDNNEQKAQLAKYLNPSRLSKRNGCNSINPSTLKLAKNKSQFLIKLSIRLNWEIKDDKYLNFVGLRNWRKPFIDNSEAVMFSTNKILNLTSEQFNEWFNNQPRLARHRIASKVINNDKYIKFRNSLTDNNIKQNKQDIINKLTNELKNGNNNYL